MAIAARNTAHAEERAEVEVLSAQAEGHRRISRNLQAIQGRLNSEGQAVREALGPVHSNTRQHQTLINNIDGISNHVDKMLEAGQDQAKEEIIVRAGPAAVGLKDYIASLKRIERSISQLTASNARVNQQAAGKSNELLSEGSIHVQEHFRSALVENVQPVEPLNYLTKQLPFPSLQPDRASHLAAMEKHISSPTNRNHRETLSVRIYSDCRSPYLANSLQSLSIASISTSKRKNPEEPYRPGTSAIGTYACALEGMFVAEFQNISAVFSHDDWSMALDVTCRKALAEFAKTLRELNMQIKSNLITDCFLAYEIIEIVTNVSHRLSSKTAELKLPFAEAVKPIRETAKATLPELLDDQRRRIGSMLALPADGATVPFTADTMTRLQAMTDFPKSLSSILASVGEGNWTQPTSAMHQTNSSSSLPSLKSLDVGADGTRLLTHYILDIIETHLVSLESRARILLKSKAVHGAFISNTVALIDRMIRSSDLASLLGSNTQAQNKLDSWRKKGNSLYMDSWREPCSALLDTIYTNRSGGPRPQSGGTSVSSAEVVKSLSSKDKDVIKEKFKLFNTTFDECVKRHRELRGSMEREVKSGLGRDVGNVVEPLYARFWDRYEALDRGRGKYVRYDKGALAAVLAGLE